MRRTQLLFEAPEGSRAERLARGDRLLYGALATDKMGTPRLGICFEKLRSPEVIVVVLLNGTVTPDEADAQIRNQLILAGAEPAAIVSGPSFAPVLEQFFGDGEGRLSWDPAQAETFNTLMWGVLLADMKDLDLEKMSFKDLMRIGKAATQFAGRAHPERIPDPLDARHQN